MARSDHCTCACKHHGVCVCARVAKPRLTADQSSVAFPTIGRLVAVHRREEENKNRQEKKEQKKEQTRHINADPKPYRERPRHCRAGARRAPPCLFFGEMIWIGERETAVRRWCLKTIDTRRAWIIRQKGIVIESVTGCKRRAGWSEIKAKRTRCLVDLKLTDRAVWLLADLLRVELGRRGLDRHRRRGVVRVTAKHARAAHQRRSGHALGENAKDAGKHCGGHGWFCVFGGGRERAEGAEKEKGQRCDEKMRKEG